MRFDGLYPSTIIKDVKILIEDKYDVPSALQNLELLKKPLDDQTTLDQCGITNGAVVDFTVNFREPLIYFCVPVEVVDRYSDVVPNPEGTKHVEVKLTLDRAWEMSIAHPSMEISSRAYVQSVTWTLDARLDGTLIDCNSLREATYLFWDGL
jgi:hypothetical protein